MDIFEDAVVVETNGVSSYCAEPDGEFDFDSFSELVSVLGSPTSSSANGNAEDGSNTAAGDRPGKLHGFKRVMQAQAFEDFTQQATHTYPGVQLCVGSNPLRNGVLLLLPSAVVWARRMDPPKSAAASSSVLANNSRKANRRESFDLVTIKAFDRAATANAEAARMRQYLVYEFDFASISDLEAQHFGPVTQVILNNDIIFELEFLASDSSSRHHEDFAQAFHAAAAIASANTEQTETLSAQASPHATSVDATPPRSTTTTIITSSQQGDKKIAGTSAPISRKKSSGSPTVSATAETPRRRHQPAFAKQRLSSSSSSSPSSSSASSSSRFEAQTVSPDEGHAGAAKMILALQQNMRVQVSMPIDGGSDWRNDVRRFVALQTKEDINNCESSSSSASSSSSSSSSSSQLQRTLACTIRDRISGHPDAASYPLPAGQDPETSGQQTAAQRKKHQRQLVRSLLPAVEEMTKARTREEKVVEQYTGARWERSRAGHFSYFDAKSNKRITVKEFERRYRAFTATKAAHWTMLTAESTS